MGVRTRTNSRLAQVFLTVVSVASAATAYAQAPGAPPPPPADAPPPPPAYPPPAPMAAPPPPAYPPPPPAVEAGPSDLNPSVRRFAIGYAGISQVPVGIAGPGSDITIPALGLRYWMSPTMGLDVALGIGWSGGSVEDASGTSTDKDSVFGFVLQAGLPFALSTHRHVSFQVIPFVDFARGMSTLNSGTTYSTDVSGTRVDIGARAGFEVFFGFIGMPELALSATVGAQFRFTKYQADQAGLSQSDTTLIFVTTVENNPWDFFAGNVAARYYF